jgi:hypothetical protein
MKKVVYCNSREQGAKLHYIQMGFFYARFTIPRYWSSALETKLLVLDKQD